MDRLRENQYKTNLEQNVKYLLLTRTDFEEQLDRLRETDINDVELNIELIVSIFQQNRNRLTNLYGFCSINTSHQSSRLIKLITNQIKDQNYDQVKTALIEYLQEPTNIGRNLYSLLLKNFSQLFKFKIQQL